MTISKQPLRASDSVRLATRWTTRLRALPIGGKFAVAVVVLLLVVALATIIFLNRATHKQLVQAKARGAEMIVDSVAMALAPALDFDDRTAVTQYAERLSATRDVIEVVVWNQASETPIFSRPQKGSVPIWIGDGANRVTESAILLSRTLITPLGARVGRLQVTFSLAPENQRFREARSRILLLVGSLTLLVAALVIVIARFLIVKRVQQLLAATSQLRLGREVSVPTSSPDEIGKLACGFNEMALAIRDRERKLSIERDKSHELLDNMRQAILVTDSDGRLTDARSRQAEVLFGTDKLGCKITDVLCGDERPLIERRAFDEWLNVAFSLGHRRWTEVSELAPTEATVRATDGKQHVLTIDTCPIILDGKLIRIMFLCTDVTTERDLKRAVQEKEREHDRQMRVMRSLLAGHGLQLVATLRNVETRIVACQRLVSATDDTPASLNEVFQYVHSIKGDASAYELEVLAQTAAAIEAKLSDLRTEAEHGQPADPTSIAQELAEGVRQMSLALEQVRQMVAAASPVGSDILDQVAVRNRDLVALHEVCVSASEPVQQVVNRLLSQPFAELVAPLQHSAQRWAERLNKQISIEIQGGNVCVSRSLAQVLPAAMTHLVRNAVSHGVETPAERRKAGKPETGSIRLQCREAGHDVEIHVVDDGRGLDAAKLLEVPPAATGVSAEDIAFLPGTSTAEGAAVRAGIAGCGVGLGAVRAELARLDYGVALVSTAGKGVDVRLFRTQLAVTREARQ